MAPREITKYLQNQIDLILYRIEVDPTRRHVPLRPSMAQSGLDNGRAIMLVGVAPAVPAEFLVFRLMREGGDNAVVEAAA